MKIHLVTVSEAFSRHLGAIGALWSPLTALKPAYHNSLPFSPLLMMLLSSVTRVGEFLRQ